MKHKILNLILIIFLILSLTVYGIGDINTGLKTTVYALTLVTALTVLTTYVLQFFTERKE